MLAKVNILFLSGMILFSGNGAAIASEDNPWAMDEPANRQKPYYDLGSGAGSGPFVPPTGAQAGAKPPSALPGLHGNVERGDRFFGYAGPQSGAGAAGSGQMENGQPAPGQSAPDWPASGRSAGETGGQSRTFQDEPPGGGVRFKGRLYGSFPPLEKKSTERERQEWQAFQRFKARQKKRQSSGFANVAPPPVPEPGSRLIYPYAGYGLAPGYDPGAYGAGGYGLPGFAPGPYYGVGGLFPGMPGPLYGPVPVDPGILGLTLPGVMW